jgi:hypothetical protein
VKRVGQRGASQSQTQARILFAMTISAPARKQQRDPLRAVFLCLAVLVQLLLPAAIEPARAKGVDGCIALGGDSGKAPAHAHDQQCAHCRPHAIALAAPAAHPVIASVAALERSALHASHAVVEVPARPLPPPTGPPALMPSI